MAEGSDLHEFSRVLRAGGSAKCSFYSEVAGLLFGGSWIRGLWPQPFFRRTFDLRELECEFHLF